MVDKKDLKRLINEKLEGTEFFLVDITVSTSNIINVYLDGDNGIVISDCMEISRYLESHYDREQEDFELTVSSAGITKPYTVFRQYKKNIGKHVELFLKDNTKKIGVLLSADENKGIEIETVTTDSKKKKKSEPEKIFISFEEINIAKGYIVF
ncbi:MAG: ribosome assembly cofactor RimP [Bacteroidota bacterium]|nr:ribosome assembly cofactor RimP [Bacteroidota bacterium]